MYADVSRAYFYAKAVRPVYVKLPDEDREEGDEARCGKLQLVPRIHPDAGGQRICTRQRESMSIPAPDHQGGGDGTRR